MLQKKIVWFKKKEIKSLKKGLKKLILKKGKIFFKKV